MYFSGVGHAMAPTWKSENNLQVLDLFYHLGSKDQSNSGHQSWLQVCLVAELSHWPASFRERQNKTRRKTDW